MNHPILFAWVSYELFKRKLYIMKKIKIILLILCALFVLPYQVFALQKVEVANPVFTFDPVPEGPHVSHEFIIKNTGDTLLNIEKVSPP